MQLEVRKVVSIVETTRREMDRDVDGLRRIVFNSSDDTNDIDGISELWFDTQADFEAAYATELGKRVAADSMAHVRTRTRLFVAEHVVVGTP